MRNGGLCEFGESGKLSDQEVRNYRIMVSIATVVLVPGYFMFRLENLGFIDPLWPRIVLTLLGSVIVGATLPIQFTRHVQKGAELFLFLFYSWLLFLNTINGFDFYFLILLLMFVFATQLTLRSMTLFLVYGAFVLVSIPVAYALVADPVLDRNYLIAFETGGIICTVVSGSTLWGRLSEMKERRRLVAEYRASLQEKEILLKEVHHRVKNNLQIVLSLLHLQATGKADGENSSPEVVALLDAENRIYSMALVHEELYRTTDLSIIELESYLTRLVSHTMDTHKRSDVSLDLGIEIENIPLDLDQAIPTGIIVSELVSNALKHAFKGRETGALQVAAHRRNGSVVLSIADDGPGFDFDLDRVCTDSLGLCLVQSLTAQLSGDISLDRSKGFSCTIEFPYAHSEHSH